MMIHNLFFHRGLILGLCGILMLSAAALAAGDEPSKRSRPRIVAHRGLLRHSPENTLSNFRACLELRTGFEFDVRRSKDGHLVCIHDATVDRTTNGQGNVSDMTLAELKKLDAGSWFGPTFRDERIPTIDELFQLVAKYDARSVLLAVDLKGEDEQIERDVVRLAKKHEILDRLLFIGRAIKHPSVRRRLRESDPKTHVAHVANTADEFPAALADKQADWVYVRYLPSKEEVARVQKSGKRVFLVVSALSGRIEENRAKAIALGVDAILTDFALELNRMLRR